VVRARERYEQVQALKDQGKNLTTIVPELRLARGTARRYYRAASADWPPSRQALQRGT
jgi:hypothetical protein